jgi:hypothetical protein
MRRLIPYLAKPLDALFVVLAAPAALILLAYRRIGSGRLPWTTRELRRIGLFPVRDHYYEPLIDYSKLERPLSEDRELPGIQMNVSGQLKFLEQFHFSAELMAMDLDREPADALDFGMRNPNFKSGDADYLYQFIRAIKPRRIIEIGSGHSTKVARLANLKNASESGLRATHTCIEPYEMSWLGQLPEIEVIRKRVEDCDLDWATELSAGDLLFVDSSHMIRPQGDVLKEFLEIFPRLASGVYIHVHDIRTPRDYSDAWLIKEGFFWNEQYLLEALLTNTDRYRIVGALNYLKQHHFDELKNVCPYLTMDKDPGSLYMEVV